MLFVSYDTGAVTSFCEQAIWLDHGVIRAVGNAKDICEQYFAALYQEDPRIEVAQPATSVKEAMLATERDNTRLKARTTSSIASAAPRREQIVETFGFNLDSGVWYRRG